MFFFGSLLDTDTAKVAVLGGAVGGCFALFNQLVTKTWECIAVGTSRSRKIHGMLVGTLTEATCNMETIADLVHVIRLMKDKPEGLDPEKADELALKHLKQWLAHNSIKTEAWDRFCCSDLVAEGDPDSLAIIPLALEQASFAIQLASQFAETGGLLSAGLDFVETTAKSSCEQTARVILNITLRSRRLRRSSFAFLTLVRISTLKQCQLNLEEGGWTWIERRRLKGICGWLRKAFPNNPEHYQNAVAILGL